MDLHLGLLEIGHATNTTAELWGLRDGLNLAKLVGATKLNVEIDAEVVLKLVNSLNRGSCPSSLICCTCTLLHP